MPDDNSINQLYNIPAIEAQQNKVIDLLEQTGQKMQQVQTNANNTKTSAASYDTLTASIQKLVKSIDETVVKTKEYKTAQDQATKSQQEHIAAQKAATTSANEFNTALKNTNATAQQSTSGVSKFGSAISGLGSTITTVLGAVGITAGIYGLIGFFKSSISEAEQAERSASRLRNTLNNLGQSGVFDRLVTKANELAKAYGYLDNDDVIEVFQKFITYGKLTEVQITDLTDVVINFAAKTGTSIEDASEVIIKALEGNSKALKLFGIDVKDAHTVTERFGILMDQLKPKVDGAAKAFGTTFAGQLAIAKQKMADLEEETGNKMIPTLTRLLQIVNTGLSGLDAFGKALGDIMNHGFLGGSIKFEQQRINAQQQAANESAAASVVSRAESLDEKGQLAFLDNLNKKVGEYTHSLQIAQDVKKSLIEKGQPDLVIAQAEDEVTKYKNALTVATIARDKLNDSMAAAKTGQLGTGDPNADPAAASKAAEAAKKAAEEQNKQLDAQLQNLRLFEQQSADAYKNIADDETNSIQVRVLALEKYKEEQSVILKQTAEDEITVNKLTGQQALLERNKASIAAQNLEHDTALQIYLWRKKYEEDAVKAADDAAKKKVKIEENFEDSITHDLDIWTQKKLDAAHKADQDEIDSTKKKEDAKKKLAEESFNLIQNLIIGGYERQLNLIQDLIDANHDWQNAETERISSSVLDEQTKANQLAIINAQATQRDIQLQQRMNAEKLKEARADRDAAALKILGETLFQAAKAGWITPLAIIIEAIGAVEIAALYAKPLPRYGGGTKDAKGGLSIVSERGRELLITPDGSISLTPDRASIMNIPKGSEVIPANEVDKVLASLIFGYGIGSNAKEVDQMPELIKWQTSRLEKALRVKVNNNITIDLSRSEYINKLRN